MESSQLLKKEDIRNIQMYLLLALKLSQNLLTLKLSTVVPTNSIALYVAPATDISPIICKMAINYTHNKKYEGKVRQICHEAYP